MIEEPGRVVALEPGAVWVQTHRGSTCSGCSARNGCGQGLMERLGSSDKRGLVRALCTLHLAVGDSVVIGVREDALLRGALLVYLFPLIALLASAVIASMISLEESYVIVAGLAGFFASWLVVRHRDGKMAGDERLQPVVLRAALVGSVQPSAC